MTSFVLILSILCVPPIDSSKMECYRSADSEKYVRADLISEYEKFEYKLCKHVGFGKTAQCSPEIRTGCMFQINSQTVYSSKKCPRGEN